VAVRELLLELAGKSLLDLVEGLQLRNRDEDDDSLLATTEFNLIQHNTKFTVISKLHPE
jgi:hypothetical protein